MPGFVAWGALVPLLVGLEQRARRSATAGSLFRLGGLFGFVFFLIGMHWIALLSEVAITVPWLRYPAWIVAAAYLALYSGFVTLIAGVLARPVGPRWRGAGSGGAARVPLALVFPVAFLCVEELRASGEMGFPWFQPGYTQHAYVPLLQLASLGSVSLMTLWVVLLNVLLWRSLTGRARLRSAVGAFLLVLVPWLWGQHVLQVTAPPTAAGDSSRVVALVQGNVAGEIKWSGKHQPEVLATFLRLSAEGAGRRPRPVMAIWPETATGSYLHKQVDQALAVAGFAARTGVPVFSGFADYSWDRDGRQRSYNSAALFATDGSLGPVYAKRHLVPFGERMPFQHLIPWLGRLEFGQAEWTPGERTVLFPSAAGPFSCLVCFEAIFPDLARSDVRAGARWVANITNDEWFGNSAALYQHAAMSVFRAVENRVPLARCANTGLTLVADANGRVVATLPLFEPGVLATGLPRPAAVGFPTPYTRFGDWPGLLSLLALAGFALRAAARSR